MTVSRAVFAVFEEAFNRYLRLDPDAVAKLAELHGKIILVEITGLAQRIYFVPSPQRVQVFGDYDAAPDCTLRGTPLALARIRYSRNSADQLFSGAVEISGDTQLAQHFGEVLGELDIDWEEPLSRVTGDVIAHELGHTTRALFKWGAHVTNTFQHNLQEYLQEELRLLPSRYEIEPFLAAVDTLRDDVERMEARIKRLQKPPKDT